MNETLILLLHDHFLNKRDRDEQRERERDKSGSNENRNSFHARSFHFKNATLHFDNDGNCIFF